MRKLSFWAAANPWISRVIIATAHIFLIFLGCFTGIELRDSGFLVPGLMLPAIIVLYFFTVYYYPRKEHKHKIGKNLFYKKQKICDFLLAAAAWGMVICISNNENVRTGIFTNLNASEYIAPKKIDPRATEILNSLQYRDKKSLSRSEKRILKKEFFSQLKTYAKAKLTGDKTGEGNAAIIILAIIAAVGLLYLVAALSCTLSCNGSDAAAIIVLLLGIAGIVIGLVFFFKGLKKKKEKKQMLKTQEG